MRPSKRDFRPVRGSLLNGGETGVETEVEEEGDVGLESEGKGQLVLVVDDLEDMRNLIGNALKKRGYRVLKPQTVSRAMRSSVTADPTLLSQTG